MVGVPWGQPCEGSSECAGTMYCIWHKCYEQGGDFGVPCGGSCDGTSQCAGTMHCIMRDPFVPTICDDGKGKEKGAVCKEPFSYCVVITSQYTLTLLCC